MAKAFSSIGRPLLAIVLAGLSSFAPPASAIEYWLRAEPFLMPLPGSSPVPMWGYAKCTDASFSACDAPRVPGPDLTVPVGDPVLTVHLKNMLPSSLLLNNSTSIVIPGQVTTMVPVKFPDGTGRERVRSFTHETLVGGVGDYSWTSMKPGTYLYHSGSHPQVQVQMGLYGAVMKDFAAGQVYPGVAFGNQVKLLYSEIDVQLHAGVAGDYYNPGYASTLNYEPRYFLVNGKPFQAGDPAIATLTAGQGTLLRFLNAGLQTRVPVINGLTMRLVAEDGNPYPWPANPREQYSVLLPAAKTIDAIIVPQAGAGGTAARYAVYDRRMGLSNNGAADGGMLVYLDVGSGNNPPEITSTPPLAASVGTLYSYAVTAFDPEGAALSGSLDVAPAGMVINAATGLIQWTPTAAQVGARAVTLRVTDAQGQFATQSFSVTVAAAANSPPQITSTPPLAASVGTLYSYAVTAFDPEGAALSGSLDVAPAGMVINAATGLIQWTPTAAQVGARAVTLRVTDAQGQFATQSFSVTVAAAANSPPQITSTPPLAASVGTLYSYAVTAFDPEGAALSGSLDVAPAGMVINAATGLIQWTPTAAQVGARAVTLRVTDAQGQFATQSFSVTVN